MLLMPCEAAEAFDVKDVGTPLAFFFFCCCCSSSCCCGNGPLLFPFVGSCVHWWLASIVFLVVASVVDSLSSCWTLSVWRRDNTAVVVGWENSSSSSISSSSCSSCSSSCSPLHDEWAILLCWTGSKAMPIIQIGNYSRLLSRKDFCRKWRTFDRYGPIGCPVNVGAMAGVITWNWTNELHL